MNIRERYEELEASVLSPLAARSRESRGRLISLEPCEVRTGFQRDRDRIIHSKAFRRLKHKTQVFIAPESDHYRTRLTHTLEVAQIARTIARALRLNEDLTEAIALGHDLGHTPFGHGGEKALDSVLPGGFRHCEQSLRVVDVLEGGTGLNLTWEVRDGILNHTGDACPSTLEGQVVKISDRVAYINHDIDDAIRAGIINREMLPQECIDFLGREHSQRINTMVKDIIVSSLDRPVIGMSRETGEATARLREFLFLEVYGGALARDQEKKVRFIVHNLYRLLVECPELLSGEGNFLSEDEVKRAAADYIAGMTDPYALRFFRRHLEPLPWE